MLRSKFGWALAAVMLLVCQAWALKLEWCGNGVMIKNGEMGEFTLESPILLVNDQEQKPLTNQIEGAAVTYTYAGGAAIKGVIEGNQLTWSFANIPEGSRYQLQLIIPGNYREGGKWQLGGKSGEFPQQSVKGKAQIYQENAEIFSFGNYGGQSLTVRCPAAWAFQQLTDFREWNWPVFSWRVFMPLPNMDPQSFTITGGSAAAKVAPRVDRFGQTTLKEYPGKVTGEQELRNDAKEENAYYQKFEMPKLDRFGGLPGSGAALKLTKTGYFHVQKVNDRQVMVDPDGNLFFQLGICCMDRAADYTYVTGRESIYEWLPPRSDGFEAAWHPDRYWNPSSVSFYDANYIRKYGKMDENEFLSRMIDRVRAFGFNSAGAFSGKVDGFTKFNFPFVESLPLAVWQIDHLPGLTGIFDPFDPAVRQKIDRSFAKVLSPNAQNPYLIGYFLANEQSWQDLTRAVPLMTGKQACKLELVKMLQKKYASIDDFNRVWESDAKDFAALDDMQLAVKTKAANADMLAYYEYFLETYFKLVTETFKKYDTNHLLLGNRWQPGTANSEILCRITGKYMDVISINYYTSMIDKNFIRRIYDWTGQKPQLWSEFYYTGEREAGPGSFSFDLATQRERGLAYRNYVETAASLGFVVGIEWFTLVDQPVTGRFFEKYNGESCNTGLFSVVDRPYREMIDEMAKTHQKIYEVIEGKAEPYIFDHPQFVANAPTRRTADAGRALPGILIDGQDKGYPLRPPMLIPADRVVSGAGGTNVEASFKACWDDQNLYLIVQVRDQTPMQNSQTGNMLWSADGIELFLGSENLEDNGPMLFSDLQILIGAGRDGQIFVSNHRSTQGIVSAVVPAADGKGYTLEVALPWKVLGVDKVTDGMKFRFDLAVDDSSNGKDRQAQLMWSGSHRNSSDRGAWGELRLSK